MNEKVKIFGIALIAGIVIGIMATGFYCRRSFGESIELNRRINQLVGELAERDQQIGDLQRGIRSGVEKLIGYVDDARVIIKRANEGTTGIISNLKQAADFIKQGIEERKNLEMELDNIRAGVFGIGDLAGPYPKQIEEGENENE